LEYKLFDQQPTLAFQPTTNDKQMIEKLLTQMTLAEKAGQMTQLNLDMICVGEPYQLKQPHRIDKRKLKRIIKDLGVGSFLNTGTNGHSPEWWQALMTDIQNEAKKTRLKIPVLYGIDAIHGVNYTVGGTLFPQPLAVASTWNLALATKLAEITAYEARASGIPWNFSPALDLCRNPVWSRMWENFGEDVHLISQFGVAMVKGYQGSKQSSKTVAACLKHFTGYGAVTSGKDRTPSLLPEYSLQEYHLPQYQAAIDAGALSVMINNAEINGVPVHSDRRLLTDILRGQLGFKGLVVSDFEEILNLHTRHRVASTYKEAVKMAINAGIDMAMVPMDTLFTQYVIELTNEGEIPISRIDDAVRNILGLKQELGLFENTHLPLSDFPEFGGAKHQAHSLETALECIVLLKNEGNLLPISKKAKVLVVGSTSNSYQSLNGGWTQTWQGNDSDLILSEFPTIIEAIKNEIGAENVSQSLDEPADFIVLCLGEQSYTELCGTINDLHLDDEQITLTQKLVGLNIPIILLLSQGRPRLISKIEANIPSILLGFYAGPHGGTAFAKILFGENNPSGKLPLTYPSGPNGTIPYDHKYNEASTGGIFPTGKDAYFCPQFEFGHGLSYTEFKYSDLSLDKKAYGSDESIQIGITVTNTGNRKGKEVVQVFLSDLYASMTPSVKKLKAFRKIDLEPNQSERLVFILTQNDLAFVGKENNWVVEAGEFKVGIGGLECFFHLIGSEL
jgi:beta-glucosidase